MLRSVIATIISQYDNYEVGKQSFFFMNVNRLLFSAYYVFMTFVTDWNCGKYSTPIIGFDYESHRNNFA